jgi:hypothetical protein
MVGILWWPGYYSIQQNEDKQHEKWAQAHEIY